VSTISENTIAQSAVGGDSNSEGQYSFDFEYIGLQIAVTDNQSEGSLRPADGATVYDHFRPAIRADITATIPLEVAEDGTILTKFNYVDTATFSLLNADGSYQFKGLPVYFQDDYPGLPIAPIGVNAIGDIQYEGPQNFQPGLVELTIDVEEDIIKSTSRITQGDLEIAVVDNDDGRAAYVRPEDGKEEWPWFRPALQVDRVYVTPLSFAALAGDDTAYFFASAGIDRLPNYAGLPISPISVNAIGTLQYEGVMDYQPSIGQLDLADADTVSSVHAYADSAALDIAVDWNDGPGVVRDSDGKIEYPYFRPTLEVDRSYVPFKSLAVISEEYKFEYSIDYQILTGSGIPIGPLSLWSIAEEQQIPGALANFVSIQDTIALEIAATSELGTNRLEYEFLNETVALEIDETGTIFAVYPRTETTALEIEASDTVGKKFVYDDTAQFALITPTSIVSISATVEVTPLLIGVTSVIEKVYNIVTTVELELETSQAETNVRYNIPTDTITTEIDADDSISTTYKPRQGFNPVEVLSVSSSYRLSSQSVYEYVLEFSSTNSPFVNDMIANINTAVNETGYDLNDNEVYITFWKAGVIQHAIRHLSNSQTVLGTRSYYNYDKPRATAITRNGKQAILLDTNPRGLSFVAATFNNQTYNLTTSGFQFDEIRYYQGDPANLDDMLLWSTSVARDIEVEADASAGLIYNYTDYTQNLGELEIDATSPHLVSYIGLDNTAELEIGTTFTTKTLYDFVDTGAFIKGGATGIVVTLGSIDTTPLVIGDADAFEILYNYTDYTHNLGELELGDAATQTVLFNYTDYTHNLGELEIDASDVSTQSYASTTTGALEIDASDVSTQSYAITTTGALEIDALYPFEITVTVSDTGTLEISETGVTNIIYNYADSTSLEIEETHTTSTTHVFADSATFIKLGATDTDIIYDIEDTTNLEIEASEVLKVIYDIEDTANLEIAASDTIVQIFEFDDDAIFKALVAVDEDIIRNVQTTIALEIEASDTIVQIFEFDDDAIFKALVVVDEDIIRNVQTTGALEIAASDTIVQIFEFDDDAIFKALVAVDEDIIRNIQTTVALEIESSEVLNIIYDYPTFEAELEIDITQAIGITETSTGVLIVGSTSTQSIAYNFDDSVDFVKLGAVDTSFTTNRDALVELEIATTSVEKVIYNYVDDAELGVVTASDQQIIYVFADVEFVTFNAIQTQSSTLNSVETPLIEVEVDGPHNQLYALPVTTGELELDALATVAKTFNFEDTVELGVLGATDTEFIYNFENVEFVSFAATEDIDVIYNIDSTTATELSDSSTQSSTRQFIDDADFVTFVAASTEIMVNIDNEGELGFAATDEIDVIFNFTPQAFLETEVQDNINQSVSRRTTAPLEFSSITNQYYYTKFKQIYANDTIEIVLKGEGDGLKVSGQTQEPSRQIWIG